MIGRIRHKGLKRLYEQKDAGAIGGDMRKRVVSILSTLATADSIEDVDGPGYRLHPLTGDRQGVWSVRVNANWRITFRFVNGAAYDVDLEDYH
jgi:proteic killer suppression protein